MSLLDKQTIAEADVPHRENEFFLHQKKADFIALSAKVVVLLFVCALFFWRIVAAGADETLAGIDIINLHYYAHEFTRESLLNGVIPKWNPYEYCGMPFAADPGNCVFYPFNKLFLFIPTSQAISLIFVGHIFFAGLGMLLFVRTLGMKRGGDLLAAISFMLSGYFLDRIVAGQEFMVTSSAYLPWLFVCYELASQRRNVLWSLLGGALFGLQLLAGSGQPALYSGLFLGAYMLIKNVTGRDRDRLISLVRDSCYLLMMGIAGAAFAAIQIIPAAELAHQSIRTNAAMDFVLSLSFPPKNLVHLLFPYLDIGSATTNWESSCYFGIFPLTLALAVAVKPGNKRVWPIMAVGMVAAAIMMARYNPLFPLMVKVVPLLKFFRIHARAEVGFVFAMVILAAIGWERCIEDRNAYSKGMRFRALGVAIVFLLVAGAVVTAFLQRRIGIHYPLPFPGERVGEFIDAGKEVLSLRHAHLLAPLLSIIISFLFSLCLFRRPHKYFSAVVLVFVITDLFMANFGRIRMVPTRYLTREDNLIEFIKSAQSSGYFRVWLPDDMLFGSRAKYFKVFDVNGFNPLSLSYFETYLKELTSLDAVRSQLDLKMNRVLFSRKEPLSNNLLNVKYFAYEPLAAQYPILIGTDNFFPRARFVQNYVVGPPEEFEQFHFDPMKTVFLHDAPPSWIRDQEKNMEGGTASIASYSNDEIVLSVEAPTNGFVVLSEIYYPGWHAEVDGVPAQILKGDFLLRVIPVPKGTHKARIYFGPMSLRIGAFITFFAVFAAGAMTLAVLNSRRRSGMAFSDINRSR
jgi:hypothetical protein